MTQTTPFTILICDEMLLKPEHLTRDGFTLDYVANMPRADVLARLPDYDALITRSRTKVDVELLAAGPRLKVIGRGGVGVDNIDVEAASRRGILVLNAPEANTASAAELALTLMFAASRGVARSDKLIRTGTWDRKYLGREVEGKTLGIVGLGRIGSIVAKRAKGLEMKVIAYDPYIGDTRFEVLGVERARTLDDMLPRIEVLTVHTPATEETIGMIGPKELERLKAGAIVVNAARGGIVQERALAAALADGHVFAAGVDVFTDEPPPTDHPLLGRDDVVLTAHLGANTSEAQARVGIEIVDSVCKALLGDVSRGAINAPALDADTMERLGPYLTLAERMGRMLSQLGLGAASEIAVEFAGRFPGDTEPVFTSVLVGYLRSVTDQRPNLINARALAKERGITLTQRSTDVSEEYANEVRVTLHDGERVRRVSGTVFGRQPRLTRIKTYRMELPPEGVVLVCTNLDRPGVVGKVGTLLGSKGINIAGMQLGRADPGGKALFTLSLDSRPDASLVEEIRNLDVIESVFLTDFSN
jgi:D-3-phosphoglycerate dehydrogenase